MSINVTPLEIIDKYYSKNPELRTILLTHSEQVMKHAVAIAEAHPELNADIAFIKEAAMLHDIGIIFCDAPKIHCTGTHHYIEHGYLGAELLRNEGLPRHASVAERHTGTGLTLDQILYQDLPLPHQDFSPRTIEEQIICYADKFYSKSHIGETLPISKIRQSLFKYGHDTVRRFEMWHERFGLEG